MATIGNRVVQSSDPGAVGAGYQWLDTTTGNLYERNTTNSGWVLLYNVNQTNGGLLPLTGGNLSGSITGATGFASTDSPNFTTSAKLEGVNLATTRDLDNLQEQLTGEIDQKVSSSISALTGGQNANVAVAMGVASKTVAAWATETFTIPLPVFTDRTEATEAQCAWIVGLYKATHNDHGTGDVTVSVTITQVSGRTYKITWPETYATPTDTSKEASFSYLIIATR